MVENHKNEGYISIFGDYVIHKESDSGLLIVGNPAVGKSFLVSKFLGVRDDLTQDPDSAWVFGCTDFVYARSDNSIHYIKSGNYFLLNYRGKNWSESNKSDTVDVKVELADDPDRDRILKGIIYLKQRRSKNKTDLYELQWYQSELDTRPLIDEWKKNKILKEVTYKTEERETVLERIVAEETERFSSFSVI